MHIILSILLGVLGMTPSGIRVTAKPQNQPNRVQAGGQDIPDGLIEPLRIDLERIDNGEDMITVHAGKKRDLPYFRDLTSSRNPCDIDARIDIDTGSSEFWLDTRFWCRCFDNQPAERDKCLNDRVSIDARSTIPYKYQDGVEFQGNLNRIDLWFSRRVMRNVEYLAAKNVKDPNHQEGVPSPLTGMVGLGYHRNQQRAGEKIYATLPYALQRSGYTRSGAYSMWFEDVKSSTNDPQKIFRAVLIFGGHARNKYDGDLTIFPIRRNAQGQLMDIKVQLDRVLLDRHSSVFGRRDLFPSCKYSLDVLLDTGTYATWLPNAVFDKMVEELSEVGHEQDTVIDSFNGERRFAVFSDCSSEEFKDATVDFYIGQVKIQVPMNDIIRPLTEADVKTLETDPKYKHLNYKHQSEHCITHGITAYLGETPAAIQGAFQGPNKPAFPDGHWILGVTFLRHAYVLYDLNWERVSLAPVAQDARSIEADLVNFDDIKTYERMPEGRDIDARLGEKETCIMQELLDQAEGLWQSTLSSLLERIGL